MVQFGKTFKGNIVHIEDLRRSDKISGIYKIENVVNKKIYIGSSNNLYFRYTRHFNALKQNKHHCIKLQRSFNKYGGMLLSFQLKPVYQCSLEGVVIKLWGSTRELNKHFGVECHQGVSGVANGKRKSCKGYTWKFKID